MTQFIKFLRQIFEINLMNFYILFFLYRLYKYIRNTEFLHLYRNEWAFSETLINFSGGFTRRGLLGEIFDLTIKNTENIVLASFLFYLVSIVHLLYFVILKVKKFSILNQIITLIVPFGLIYFANNLNFLFGRRDLLILNLLIFFTQKKNIDLNKFYLIIFLIFGILASMMYEVFLLFIPLFFLYFKNNVNQFFVKIIFITIIIFNLVILTFYSTPKNFKLLCENITTKREQLFLNNKGCWGAPAYLETSSIYNAVNEISGGLQFTGYFIWLVFLMILYIFITNVVHLPYYKMLSLMPLLLLFFIAQDYGRWLLLIFFVSLIIGEVSLKNSGGKSNLFFSILLLLTAALEMPIYLYQEIDYFKLIH